MGPARLLVPLLALALVACAGNDGTARATVLKFMEQEAGSEGFVPLRMIVTPKFLRIDEGEDAASFVLFDRSARVIYSSAADNRSILVVSAAPVTLAAPVALSHEVAPFDVDANPSPVGDKVRGVRLRTNGETCWELVVADGVAEDARQALVEFEQALAGEHARVLGLMPEDLRTPCGMANDVYVPARQYGHGFPVRSQDMRGNQRLLIGVERGVVLDPALLELPSGYRRITVNQLQGAG